MKGLLGIKLGMSQIFDDSGNIAPVTIIQAGPCFITQIKTDKTDGYGAVQMGFSEVKDKRLTRGQKGHLGMLKPTAKRPRRKPSMGVPALRHLREFRTRRVGDYTLGQELTVEQFAAGERVDVTGTTKGRGFAGVVRRHGFGGGIRTHGQSDRHRAPGSIGATSGTARVFKGKRMAGHMGHVRKTSQNLEVVDVDLERNLIAVKGSVPGHKGSLVAITAAAKN